MVATSDLIQLPYTSDLSLAGVLSVGLHLSRASLLPGWKTMRLLRDMVRAGAVELAFRRYLAGQSIPFASLCTTPVSDPGRKDISVGGRRCILQILPLWSQETLPLSPERLEGLLSVPAPVPTEQAFAPATGWDDLHVFFFLGIHRSKPGEGASLPPGTRPEYWIYLLGQDWSQPDPWDRIYGLELVNEGKEAAEVHVHGQGRQRDILAEALTIPAGRSACLQGEFYRLSYLQAGRHPPGSMLLRRNHPSRESRLARFGWKNLWVGGLEILLAGGISNGDFLQRATRPDSPPGPAIHSGWISSSSRGDCLALPVRDLYPLEGYFRRVKAGWKSEG